MSIDKSNNLTWFKSLWIGVCLAVLLQTNAFAQKIDDILCKTFTENWVITQSSWCYFNWRNLVNWEEFVHSWYKFKYNWATNKVEKLWLAGNDLKLNNDKDWNSCIHNSLNWKTMCVLKNGEVVIK